jgi:membrane-associated phospholipid phosphatase
LGGPNNFLLYQAGLRAYTQYRFDEHTWAFAQANLRLLDNYNSFVYDAPTSLPRVRTDQRSYVTTSRTTIPFAQLTRTIDLGHGHYASAYGGLLEPMYAGVGAEWLWRPWQGNWAFGVDVNQVQQREFEQGLGLRDYRTITGHATMYWNTGFDGVVAKVSAGKYLAKDTGVTVDLSRTFANGTAIGVWATKTNVSAEQFGEGSFDKGLYLNIPFDAMLPRSSPSMATVVWNPLTRDGGAKLARRFALFDLTRHADRAAWGFGPATASSTRDENNREPRSVFNALLPYRAGRPSLGTTFNLAPALTHNGLNTEALLWGTGAVGLAMAFDQPLADAIGNKGNTAQALNNIPYLLAAGVGAAAAGSLGEDARSTAYASLSAATWALGTNLLGKTLIGRSRPEEGHGPWSFEGPHRASSQSSFASNHVTAAMALATPFAQRYNQPWLYGLASLTAVGRIQANEHWASDTVAGALLGYAFGSLALQNQHSHSKGLRFSASTERVVATITY